MDCQKLVVLTKRWGYHNIEHRYLIDVYGLSQKEAEECTKEVGINIGWATLS
jgi:Mn-dependent DtxR family transcriptional regulator